MSRREIQKAYKADEISLGEGVAELMFSHHFTHANAITYLLIETPPEQVKHGKR